MGGWVGHTPLHLLNPHHQYDRSGKNFEMSMRGVLTIMFSAPMSSLLENFKWGASPLKWKSVFQISGRFLIKISQNHSNGDHSTLKEAVDARSLLSKQWWPLTAVDRWCIRLNHHFKRNGVLATSLEKRILREWEFTRLLSQICLRDLFLTRTTS